MVDTNNMVERRKTINFLNLKRNKTLIIGMMFFILFLFILTTYGSAQDSSLEEEYAPIFFFEKEEQCYPVSVEYHIDHATLFQFTGNDPVEINSDVTMEELGGYTTEQYESLYLDNTIGTTKDDNIINDYSNQKITLGFTVYAHTIHGADDTTIIQYWLFYAFNKGDLNQHEGDWELVQVVLRQGSPVELMYSQHHSGQKTSWNQAEKTGTHPHVYVARGSHANYFTSYSGTLGVASDHVGANGFILKPVQYTIIDLETQTWLPFKGMWGEINSYEDVYLGTSGPVGPMYREERLMWNQALNWGSNLPELNPTILLFEWIIYNFTTIFIVIFIISLLIFAYRRMKQYKSEGFGPRFFSFLYIDGLNMKSIGNLLFIAGIIIAFLSLIYPWYGITASSTSSIYNTEGFIDILIIDGLQGISLNLPDATGPTPLGSALIPFSLLISIGIIFTIIKTLGVKESFKLGKSYMYQGIKLLMPIIIILISIVLISVIVNDMIPEEAQESPAASIFDDVAASPFGGSSINSIDSTGENLQLDWGIQTGGILLFLSGLMLLISGIIERKAKTVFF